MIGQKLGHYEIVDKIGEGGMGVVWKARDTRLNRIVAIKVLPPDKLSNNDRKRRFIQEAQAASALNHPNIITIHDIALQNGCAFQVMEYVRGRTLDELIPAGGMPVFEALPLAAQMAEALAAAHASGIIHRDLKPHNVMVTESGRLKLLDFGLAKLAAWGTTDSDTAKTLSMTPQTEAGTVIGTVCYMSPEQAEGRHVDARSDIFSFGALLYEMLSGRRAFDGDTPVSMLTSVLRDEPPGIQSLQRSVPAELEMVVTRCLRKDAAERFQNIGEIAPYLTSQQTIARDASQSPATCSIAVLPFASMSPAIENQCFADGLTEEIIYQLARLDGLQVVARTVAAQTRGEGCARALEGSVRSSGPRLRVTVQLFDPIDGRHVWSERYEREVGDPLTVQDELASLIASQVAAQTAESPHPSPVARKVRRDTKLD